MIRGAILLLLFVAGLLVLPAFLDYLDSLGAPVTWEAYPCPEHNPTATCLRRAK